MKPRLREEGRRCSESPVANLPLETTSLEWNNSLVLGLPEALYSNALVEK
jgi:hypothetical protein